MIEYHQNYQRFIQSTYASSAYEYTYLRIYTTYSIYKYTSRLMTPFLPSGSVIPFNHCEHLRPVLLLPISAFVEIKWGNYACENGQLWNPTTPIAPPPSIQRPPLPSIPPIVDPPARTSLHSTTALQRRRGLTPPSTESKAAAQAPSGPSPSRHDAHPQLPGASVPRWHDAAAVVRAPSRAFRSSSRRLRPGILHSHHPDIAQRIAFNPGDTN